MQPLRHPPTSIASVAIDPTAFGERVALPPLPPPPFRRARESDRRFIIELTKEKYPYLDIHRGIKWVEWCKEQPDRLLLVGPNSFGIASALWHYGFVRRGGCGVLCCRSTGRPFAGALEIVHMLKIMIRWAKEKGCVGGFRLEADAEAGVDFSPVGKLLKGKSRTTWELPLE